MTDSKSHSNKIIIIPDIHNDFLTAEKIIKNKNPSGIRHIVNLFLLNYF